MSKFIIKDDFFEIFKDAKIGVVLCKNVDNTIKEEDKYLKLLEESEKEAFKYFIEEDFSKNSVVAVWREAYTKFKTKKGARSSIEALLKRVNKGNHIGTINPLVDIYNSISLKYALPCGGEDIDKFEGNLLLTKAIGNEEFYTYGEDSENDPPYPNEIVYKDDLGAICRCWNYRESKRTLLTEDTKNAFMIIELVDINRIDDFNKALNELSNLIKANLNAETKIEILDINNKEIVIK